MLGLYAKSLAQLSLADIEELVTLNVAEGLMIEFKRDVPGSKGKVDPWMLGEKQIGDRAKRAIAREVVAFANSQGGWLLLGVEESDDDPRRACQVSPIPHAAEFATRIEQSLGDTIDPPARGVTAHAVPTDAVGAGVVVIRVPPSNAAPHRLDITGEDKEAFVRRGARVVPLTMTEIQDMTLLAAKANDRLEAVLEGLRKAYGDLDLALEFQAQEQGYRISAAPVRAQFTLDRVYQRDELFALHRGLFARMSGSDQRYDCNAGAKTIGSFSTPSPMLRGGKIVSRGQKHWSELHVHDNGCVNLLLKYAEAAPPTVLFQAWLIAEFFSVAEIALRAAAMAGDAGAEVLVEVELYGRVYESRVVDQVGRLLPQIVPDSVRMVPLPAETPRGACEVKSSPRLPPYIISDEASIKEACTRFVNDVRNLCGLPNFERFEVLDIYG